MSTINFDTGIVTYDINGACKISFNPTDAAFNEKVYKAFETLDARQEEYEAKVKKAGNTKAIYDVARSLDAEMREIVDNALGEGVSNALFKEMNVYAMAGGLPVWANLLLAVMDEMDDSFAREQKLTSPRLQKYTSKYNRA